MKLEKKIFLAFLITSIGWPALATEVYFSPSTDCENRIVTAINDAKTEVVAAVYSINNRKIVDALKAAKKRGVKVRILTDHTQASQKSSGVLGMIESGLDVRLNSKFKIEHNKFGVYDGRLVSTGSFNWTGPAARSNSENCLFLTEQEIIKKYSQRFEYLWGINTADGSKARISKILPGQKGKRSTASPE
jgi:mitochondrial cardiolipin hydrolase